MDGLGVVAAIAILSFVGAYLYYKCRQFMVDWRRDAGEEARCHIVCKPFTDAMVLKERHPCLLNAIEARADRLSHVEKLPDVYVCNGEMNGNHFNGTATRIPGCYNVVQGAFTGEWKLHFKYTEFNRYGSGKWSSEHLAYLVVPAKDFAFAKQDPILSKYIADSWQGQSYVTSAFRELTAEEAMHSLHFVNVAYKDAVYIRKWLADAL